MCSSDLFNNLVWLLENSLNVYRKHMSLSELRWLGPITKLLFWTVPRIVSHFLAFETLHLTEVFPVGFGVGVLTTVFSHNVLISDLIYLFNMDGAMMVMVDVVVIFSMKVMVDYHYHGTSASYMEIST